MGRGGNLEASVRKFLPKDEQIVVALIGAYGGLFGLFKIKSALTKKPAPPPAPVAVSTVGSGSGSKWGFEPPTLETFDAWEKNPSNWAKWEAFLDSPKLDQWADSLK